MNIRKNCSVIVWIAEGRVQGDLNQALPGIFCLIIKSDCWGFGQTFNNCRIDYFVVIDWSTKEQTHYQRIHMQIPPDWLHRSHITQYCCSYCKLGYIGGYFEGTDCSYCMHGSSCQQYRVSLCCFQTSLPLAALPLWWWYLYNCASATCRRGMTKWQAASCQ